MEPNVSLIAVQIEQASGPWQVFGELKGDAGQQQKALRQTYHQLLKCIHPDKVADITQQPVAQQATVKLNKLYQAACQQVKDQSYGPIIKPSSPPSPVIIRNGRQEYVVEDLLSSDSVAKTFRCHFRVGLTERQGLLKVAHQPVDNDLVEQEARVLQRLNKAVGMERFSSYVPQLVDSFRYREAGSAKVRQVVVSQLAEEAADPQRWYSLEEVRSAYPSGIDGADMAWIWRRLLVVMGFAHQCGVVHGAVYPANIWIEPTLHGLVLTNWSYSVIDPQLTKAHLEVPCQAYQDWCPDEVWHKATVSANLDLHSAGQSMAYIMGGDGRSGQMPVGAEARFAQQPQRLAQLNWWTSTDDAWQLLQQYDSGLGKRHFRAFVMPEKSSGY